MRCVHARGTITKPFGALPDLLGDVLGSSGLASVEHAYNHRAVHLRHRESPSDRWLGTSLNFRRGEPNLIATRGN